jgi:predicted AlkP superfamily phosphohydrolase/phosphomutase
MQANGSSLQLAFNHLNKLHFFCRLGLGMVVSAAVFLPEPAYAYIGPGAGFAFLGSAFVFILTIALALLTILAWPLQWSFRKIRGKGVSKRARARRIIIVGLDGLEPKLAEQYMKEGKLPNMKALSEQGSFERLGTTLPALSPVAWSTFQTGVNPGAHNIFDFLTRDKRFCLPQLASTETVLDRVRKFGIGALSFKWGRPKVVITRKSQPFWKILGKYGIFSNIIRVPISYPPEKFGGNILSAMCTPDLKGSQGSFTFFSTDNSKSAGEQTGGQLRSFKRDGDTFIGEIEGPPNPKGQGYLTTSFTLTAKPNENSAILKIGDRTVRLERNMFSEWLELEFRYGRKRVSGIARFCLRVLEPHLELYVSPVNVNPEKPALPIAWPVYFSTWLAKRNGPYGTLGLMEDTWGRNELALDDRRFLDQAYLNHSEREKMFFDALDRTREGLCVCVFDASDRIQHMFWRYLDPDHPSPRESDPNLANTIPEMYQEMDRLVGRVTAKLKPDDFLVVLSDHGFASFRRGINLNTWLYEQGYLVVKDKVTGADFFKDVDWSKTKAFAVGLSGIYLNRQGREVNGIVTEEETEVLRTEIARKLETLTDPKDGKAAIRKVYDTSKVYKGLYTDEAPDLIVGYEPGHRVSWDSITGGIENSVFSDNIKAWSGDHHVDPKLIPGVLFTNRKLKVANPHIADIAPTALDMFAIKIPAYMEGKVLV